LVFATNTNALLPSLLAPFATLRSLLEEGDSALPLPVEQDLHAVSGSLPGDPVADAVGTLRTGKLVHNGSSLSADGHSYSA